MCPSQRVKSDANIKEMTSFLFWSKLCWSCARLLNRNTLQSQSHNLLKWLLTTLIPSQVMANLYLCFPHWPQFCWLHISWFAIYHIVAQVSFMLIKKKVHRFSEWIHCLCKHWKCLEQELKSAWSSGTPLVFQVPWAQLGPKHVAADVVGGGGNSEVGKAADPKAPCWVWSVWCWAGWTRGRSIELAGWTLQSTSAHWAIFAVLRPVTIPSEELLPLERARVPLCAPSRRGLRKIWLYR